MESLFYPDPLIRLPLYAAFGLVAEILFTGIMDLVYPRFLSSWRVKQPFGKAAEVVGRDSRAVGYTFLWMIPIYMALILIEPLSQWVAGWSWFFRGLVYLGFLWIGEYISGVLIKKISGVNPWDYSYSKYSVGGYIRWDFAPLWFGFGLLVEFMSQKFVALTPAIRAVLVP